MKTKQKTFLEVVKMKQRIVPIITLNAYIDFLEDYWKSNPGKFEEHDQKFGDLDDKADVAIINSLKQEKFDFSDYLESIARDNGWLDEE